MKRSSLSVVIFSILLLALAVWLAINISNGRFTETGVAVGTPGPSSATACPVSLSDPQMVPQAEMNISATVTNTSPLAISTLAFGASHTDKFGNTQEPFESDLRWDEIIAPGASLPVHWNISMEQPSLAHNRKPGSSELHLNKVVFEDGKVLTDMDLAQCKFDF